MHNHTGGLMVKMLVFDFVGINKNTLELYQQLNLDPVLQLTPILLPKS